MSAPRHLEAKRVADGTLWHAVHRGSQYGEALCGRRPTVRRGGWRQTAELATVDCERCAKLLSREQS